VQRRYPQLDIGSYPYERGTGNGVAIVAKGTDPALADRAVEEVAELIAGLGHTPVMGEPPP